MDLHVFAEKKFSAETGGREASIHIGMDDYELLWHVEQQDLFTIVCSENPLDEYRKVVGDGIEGDRDRKLFKHHYARIERWISSKVEDGYTILWEYF